MTRSKGRAFSVRRILKKNLTTRNRRPAWLLPKRKSYFKRPGHHRETVRGGEGDSGTAGSDNIVVSVKEMATQFYLETIVKERVKRYRAKKRMLNRFLSREASSGRPNKKKSLCRRVHHKKRQGHHRTGGKQYTGKVPMLIGGITVAEI